MSTCLVKRRNGFSDAPCFNLSFLPVDMGEYLHDATTEYLQKRMKTTIVFSKEGGMLSKCQHAFRKLHNTLTSLLNITDSWFANADKRKINISIFLELKKAFDTVDRKILLSKL